MVVVAITRAERRGFYTGKERKAAISEGKVLNENGYQSRLNVNKSSVNGWGDEETMG